MFRCGVAEVGVGMPEVVSEVKQGGVIWASWGSCDKQVGMGMPEFVSEVNQWGGEGGGFGRAGGAVTNTVGPFRSSEVVLNHRNASVALV